MYSGSLNNLSNNAQSSAYGSSGYEWSGQSAYSNQAPSQQSNEAYHASSDYGYQRGGTYESQSASSMSNPYSQDYYGRTSVGQSRQPAHSQNEGLSNLAYVSGLESANSRSSTTRSTQPYEIPAPQQQNRVRSPFESQTQYSVNPPATASSSPMQQQGSSSSVSSNQLAVDAAAALAGAVGRRNASSVQYNNFNTTMKSPNMGNARSNVSTTSRQTTSPQTNTVSRSHQSYASSQPQPQQRSMSTQFSAASSQNATRQAPANVASNSQSQQVSHQQTPQNRPNTRSSPRSIRQTGSIAHLVTAAHETESVGDSRSPETHDLAPTFIDPTSIFDPYAQERERRRQAAERAAIEAKRQAEEEAKRKAVEAKEAAEAAERKRLEDEAAARRNQAVAKSAQSNSSSKRRSKETPAPAAQNEEERMAAELKAMMERMKAFQCKDPSLFKKLWDDMRKPGPAVAAAAVDTPSPQPVQQASPAPDSQPPRPSQPTVVPVQPPAHTRTPKRDRKTAKVGPDGQPLHLNGYPVVVEDNPEGLPDLGRFPAERRVRQSYGKKRTSKGNLEEANETIDPTSTSPPSASAPPVRTSAAKLRTPSSTAISATPAALSQVLQTTAGGSTEKSSGAKSSSGTIWPLEKRNALTSTALRALKAIPENQNVPLTEDDLQKMLETNPSYIDLCQQLEARGLKFHRGHFARELLNSVPDLKGGTPTSQPVTNNAPPGGPPVGNSISGAPAQALGPPPPQTQPQSQPAYHASYHPYPTPPQYGPVPPHTYPPQPYGPPAGQWVQTPGPYQFGPVPTPSKGPPPPARPHLQKQGIPSNRPEPPPGPKEAAARKRDFSELIDLTELGDDDNYVVPDKHPRLEGPDSEDESGFDPYFAYRLRKQNIAAALNPPSGLFAPPAQLSRFDSSHPGPKVPPELRDNTPEGKAQRFILAKPLNKEEALTKQYYDPKTVARDILIATGRHPSERPLNVHLAGMLGKYIELDSDVDTFEWDEVDPGGPPIPKVAVADVPASKPRFKLGKRVQKKNRKLKHLSAIDKTRGLDAEKRAKDAAPATSQPAQVTPNGVISKSIPIREQLRKEVFKKPSSKLRHSLLASDEQATPAQFDPTRPPEVQSDRPSSKPPSTSKPAMSQEPAARRKPGRPPGSKNKFPSVAGLKAQAGDLKVKINVPHRESTPAPKEKFKCKWKKCSTVLHNLDTLRKHIGRVHRPSSTDPNNEGYICWWKKCKYLKQDEETGEWTSTKVFDHWEDWLKHIEKEHVTPIALRWGDGPATSHVGKQQTPSRS